MTESANDQTDWLAMQRVRRAVVVVDVVESVRLMQAFEADVIARWRRFVNEVRNRLLPERSGRMVKSLGDGMLLEFALVPEAVAAALDIQALICSYNVGCAADAAIWLRIGVHSADVVVDELDIFGHGVNLPARLCALARPGEIVLSAVARDLLVPSLDAEVEDMGECRLKGVETLVRAFRVTAPQATFGRHAATWLAQTHEPALTASVAVVPLSCHGGIAFDAVIGDIIADGVIAQLARTPELVVLSRLSTAALRNRALSLTEIENLTGARFVLSGSYAVSGDRVVVSVELAESRTQSVIWADRLACAVSALLEVPSELLQLIAQQVHMAMLESEAQRVTTQPLPTLESFSLLYGGIGLLHRSSPGDFSRARDVLGALAERVPRHGSSYAWMAKWHCLRIIRGQVPLSSGEGSEALRCIELALERDPDSALAWALNALVQSWVTRSLEACDSACSESLARNPNEALAWLFTCTLRSWQGRGAEAAQAAERALELSHLDPMRYYYETLSAAGLLAHGEYDRAATLCERSLRVNRLHTPTHRVLAISQMLSGQDAAARDTVRAMLGLQAGYTVQRFLDSYPGAAAPHARVYADALRAAGLPA